MKTFEIVDFMQKKVTKISFSEKWALDTPLSMKNEIYKYILYNFIQYFVQFFIWKKNKHVLSFFVLINKIYKFI